ncbi:cytochrome d ubiquinol oxidase subunit II [Chitiniphilus purpureus]|uniref:Cytochrome d ubiquinol oxidase subunit II n=1 Tax=Chitiniphilus purpureus TaxID=2981137 RepID=A0ABY6DKT1_9NEIS|nr:cytochrome d ubiquinol oxidase subunit II [Chitiniphilus sp. CD1]UXY14642.1 cytochrome d ubiquinol oxidase subunit II [Chitiniphilus sp. CD1]
MPESGMAYWLPLASMALMGLAVLVYVVLDGYDLGVGILLRHAHADEDKDLMIAAIGPFWDANETWLVLGIGLLLVAFPLAHGVILGALYLPVTAMLFGLILRGVAFDFRVKARAHHKPWWNRAFHAGSLIAALAQGAMLGLYITGFRDDAWGVLFAAVVALGLCAGYALLGAAWLILKTEGALQRLAVRWARGALGLTAVGVAAVSLATPLVSRRVFDKWFSWPELVFLAPIPLATMLLFFGCAYWLQRLPARLAQGDERGAGRLFAAAATIFALAFCGLAYSLFPYLVVDRIDLWQAASAPESLAAVLIGVAIVLPTIAGYTLYAYRVFRGKATALHYH